MESSHESVIWLANASKLERSNSSSSEEDFIQLDASELRKSVPNTGNHGDAQLASENDVGTNAIAATQSPPNQVMEKSNGPDPYRIPSSVFARSKSTTPMEWSVASNESLFSIHVDNSSFSKDGVLLGRSGELSNLPSPTEALSPSFTIGETGRNNLYLGEGLDHVGVTEAANAETMKEVLKAAADEHVKAGAQPSERGYHSASLSRRSDGSTTSTKSFAFPILTEGRSASVKVNPEQQQQQQSQPQASETTPNAAANRWFPCFSCCN